MGDFAFLAIIVIFFALAVLFVRACDRIIGPDEAAASAAASGPAPDERAAA